MKYPSTGTVKAGAKSKKPDDWYKVKPIEGDLTLVSVDTGVKTGYCHMENGEFVELSTQRITKAMYKVLDLFNGCKESGATFIILIEDVRQRTWVNPKFKKERLRGIGSVERDCSVWQDFCEHHGIPHLLVHPMKGETKKSQEYFTQRTGYIYEVSDHGRDAGLLGFKYYNQLKKGLIAMPEPIKPRVYKPHKPRMPRKKKEQL